MDIKISSALIFIILSLSILLFACNQDQEPKKYSKTIGVTLLARAHIFYRDLEEGLKTEAEKYDYELIITSADWDLGKQISQMEDFIARKVDAIIVCPVDSKGINFGVNQANQAGIPVFTADIAAEGSNVIAHIASDNFRGGQLAGEYLAKLLNGKGNIAIVNQPAITSVIDRVAGFREAIREYPDLKVVADVNGEGVRDKALIVTTDVLQSNPKLDGIFGINDDSALGALGAVNQLNKKGIVIIGYDATPPAVDAILSGSPLKADVVQYPKKIGSRTIEVIKDHFEGKVVSKIVPVEVGIVDKESLQKNSSK